jgi:hypothetical protein
MPPAATPNEVGVITIAIVCAVRDDHFGALADDLSRDDS